jgi:hypothetical protein
MGIVLSEGDECDKFLLGKLAQKPAYYHEIRVLVLVFLNEDELSCFDLLLVLLALGSQRLQHRHYYYYYFFYMMNTMIELFIGIGFTLI